MTNVRRDENVLNYISLCYVQYSCIFIRYVNAYLNIRWTRMWKHNFKLCRCFFISSWCVYWCQFHSGLRDNWQLYIAHGNQLQICNCLQGKTHYKMLVIDETAHVAVRLKLLEMGSITTPNQTISIVCRRYSFQRAFKEKYGDFTGLR